MAEEVETGVWMVRSRDAGVFYGQVEIWDLSNGYVKFKTARRVWYWDGAATLSELATSGPKLPQKCKFPIAVENHIILGICEIIPVSDEALEKLDSVPVWSAQ